jgi:solute carrier family 25 oxoglutarate transporter 11
MSTW